jgi:hypothetical protein
VGRYYKKEYGRDGKAFQLEKSSLGQKRMEACV